jgi:hypothetical protein
MRRPRVFVVVMSFLLVIQLSSPVVVRQDPAMTEQAISLASHLSSEIRISKPTSPECARYYPKVAYDWVHHEYLVVWYNWWSLNFQDIYAQRVTTTGELKSSFAVATGAYGDLKSRLYPALAYNAMAGEYLVVYMYDALSDGIHYEVWGRRVAWNGSWLGSEFQIFSWANRAFWNPRVAWNSYRNEYLVVASALDTETGLWNDVAGRRVMANGTTPYPGHNISYQNQTLQPHQPDVTYNLAADEYLVVWRQRFAGDDWDIYGARVRGDNDAVVNPPGIFAIDGTAVDQRYPAVATNMQDRYLVVWQHGEGQPATDYEIYGRELNVVGGWASAHIQIAVTTDTEKYPAVAINGGNNERFVVWSIDNAIRGFNWDPLAMWILWFPFQIAQDTAWTPPAVASGSTGYLVVYGRVEGSSLHIYGRLYWPLVVFLPLVLR